VKGAKMKVKRGQKLCKNCNGINGARSHTCKHCNTEFVIGATSKNKKPAKIKKPKKFEEIEDWKSLTNGDRIKVIGRSGNYYLGENGDKQYMTDAGIYTVKNRDSDGLIVHASDGGWGYIYMGPEKASDTIPNMYRSPHKIVRANISVRVK
jgi:hypothetical protein